MKNLAIIPARGGSKRIPRKNIKDFLGKPIMVYSIEAALESKLFDEVMVSTDDEEIAEVARKYGTKLPFMRSEESSNDYAGLTDVCIEVVKYYESHGMNFNAVCCILSTAPFVSSEKIITAKKSGAIILNYLETQDIDTETDWKLAELKYKIMTQEG